VSFVLVRTETPDDHSAIRGVVVEAFEGAQEAELIEHLRRDGDLAISLVAEIGGRVCGHVALSPLKSPSRTLALAPLAVQNTSRRQGIGSALVRRAIDFAKFEKSEMIFVVGDPAYYERFGFTAAAAAAFSSLYAGPHFKALQLTEGEISAAPVIYADAFDRFG
jgi:putative acetyltransferase